MQFRVLGPLEIWDGDLLVRISGATQRIVLAMLLVHAGRVVSVDRLVDELWGERPPAQPRGAVHAYIHRLRRVLCHDAGRDLAIDTRGDGYVLTVPPDSLDSDRWRRLVTAGEAVLADGRPEDATAVLRQALALWRGPALADIDTPVVRAEAHGLNEHRWEVLERCLAAELELGRHAAVLPELQTVIAAHPYREGLHGKLMIALCQAGRQGDALAAYTRLRHRLAEDLGVDPSVELRHLHQAILRGELDPSPTAAAPGPGPVDPRSAPAVPRQLPADVPGFTGRADHLAHLDKLLGTTEEQPATVVISAVSGTAGVGKTALAVHWAHRVADRFPDGQLYVNLRGFDPDGRVMEPAEAIRGFLDTLGVAGERIPSTLHAQTALYRSLLAGKQMLVVLDNARDADQARPLLPGAPGCLAVVTSRNQLTGLVATDAAHPLTLDILSTVEASQLLAHRLGADRIAAEPDAVEALIIACARLPLALAVAAARAQQSGFALASLAAELTTAGSRLDALDAGDAPSQVRTVFSWSYTALTPPAARLFRLLGLHPGPDISLPAAASLTGQPFSDTRRLLTELTRANLLAEHVPGRYIFHDLLRTYATDLTHSHDPDGDRRAATTRVLDHYLHTAHTADRLLYPHRDPMRIPLTPPSPGTHPEHPTTHQQATTWLTTEHRVLLAALRYAADAGFDTHAWQLAWALDTYLYRRAWHDQLAAWRAALHAAERLGHPTAQADANCRLAVNEARLDRHADAHAHGQRALGLYTRAGDRTGQAHTHHNYAFVCERQGLFEAALDHAQQALALYRAAGHLRGQAMALNNVGWYHTLSGDYTQAISHCQQALTLLQQLGDRPGEGNAWDSLGYAHHRLGHHTQAAHCYQQAIRLGRDIGDRYHEATSLTHLGDTNHAAGDLDAARTAWQQALTILTDLNHPDADNVRTKLTARDTTTPERNRLSEQGCN